MSRKSCALCDKKASFKILRTNKRGKRKAVFVCKKHRKKVLKQKKRKFPSSQFEVNRLIRGVETGKVHVADCLEFMRSLPDNCVDSIITDPPYGLSELKKGKKAKAGFMGKAWDYDVPPVAVWKEALRVIKPGGILLAFAGARTYHRMAVNVEDAGWILYDTILWAFLTGFPKGGDISKHFDKRFKKERKVLGVAGKSGSKRSCMAGDFKGGEYLETAPASEEVQLWNGWKTIALKPSYEPVLLAMKELDGTYTDNALKWGVAGLNIGGSLIPYQDEKDKAQATPQGVCTSKQKNVGAIPDVGVKQKRVTFERPEQKGRYPANMVFDKEAGKFIDQLYPNASRMFFCPKATKKERNEGVEQNTHPTVKPVALMKWLATLTKTPSGGLVLDPYAGSGTTCLGCIEAERKFLACDKDKGYVKLANKRINYWKRKENE